eukprot:3601794-Lingulodinium_polyedra.AAC.1
MKTGVNQIELEQNATLLTALLELDPRGGLFSQSVVERGMKQAIDMAGLQAMEEEDLVLTAYK